MLISKGAQQSLTFFSYMTFRVICYIEESKLLEKILPADQPLVSSDQSAISYLMSFNCLHKRYPEKVLLYGTKMSQSMPALQLAFASQYY